MNDGPRRARRKTRDARRARRRVKSRKHLHRFLRFVARRALSAIFNIRVTDAKLINRRRGPFLLIANHSAVIDPFVINCFVNKPIHYVVSDSNFRSRLLAWVLDIAGSIPKTKLVSDLETVKNIVKIKAQGGVIGLFPEGQSSWDGHSLPVVPATDKLIRSLKIPVYVARLKGAYFSWPRWARGARRGRIELTFERVFSGQDLKKRSVAEVRETVERALEVDAFEQQRHAPVSFRGRRIAEYLERVLFACPSCGAFHAIRTHRQRVKCVQCGYEVRYTPTGFFEARSGPLHFETIRDWNLWQLDRLDAAIDTYAMRPTDSRDSRTPLLEESKVVVERGYKTLRMDNLGQASIRLYQDRIECELSRETLSWFVGDIEGMNVQNNEHLEFYVADSLFRITTIDPRGNTMKWDHATRRLKTLLATSAGSTDRPSAG